MIKSNLIVAAAVLSLLAAAAPASAASTHNLQQGTQTTNAYSSGATGHMHMKKMKMHKKTM